MTIQVNDETALRLERAAADAGVDVSALVERLLILEQNQHDPAVVRRRGEAIDQWLEHANSSRALLLTTAEPVSRTSEESEPYTVDEWRAMLQRSGASSGRDGRPWREFIHQGHKYELCCGQFRGAELVLSR